MNQKREKLGKLAVEAMNRPLETTDAREQGAEMTKPYLEELRKAMEDGKIKFPNKDFFITVLTKKEKLLQNVIRNYFIVRSTCPTPDYDQAVWHYKKEFDDVGFIWCIPSKPFCEYLITDGYTVGPEYFELLQMVYDFRDGKLMEKAIVFNKEDILTGNVVLEVKKDGQ